MEPSYVSPAQAQTAVLRQDEAAQQDHPWPGTALPLSHQMSVKWSTIEALRILQDRLSAQGTDAQVVLMTPMGWVQGELADIAATYEDALGQGDIHSVDAASAAVHVRTHLWNLYVRQDPKLHPSDTGAVLHLRDAVVRVGGRRCRFPHFAVFASDVAGFTLVPKSETWV
ncbi:MAG: hypothetical protein K6T31_00365 [Alicyclobacillus sp.]|nr:hypothetical protein [Alicyclobacillus sp.]